VLALEYENSRFDPTRRFKTWRRTRLFETFSKVESWSATARNPFPTADGTRCRKIISDGRTDCRRLRQLPGFAAAEGVHLAMKSGMLAAETIFEALQKGDYSANHLKALQGKDRSELHKEELWKVRNFHQSFRIGLHNSPAPHVRLLRGGN